MQAIIDTADPWIVDALGDNVNQWSAGKGTVQDTIRFGFQILIIKVNTYIQTLDNLVNDKKSNIIINPAPINIFMRSLNNEPPYGDIQLTDFLSYSVDEFAKEFTERYHLQDGGFPPLNLVELIPQIIDFIRQFSRILYDQVLRMIYSPANLRTLDKLVEEGVNNVTEVHQYVAEVSLKIMSNVVSHLIIIFVTIALSLLISLFRPSPTISKACISQCSRDFRSLCCVRMRTTQF